MWRIDNVGRRSSGRPGHITWSPTLRIMRAAVKSKCARLLSSHPSIPSPSVLLLTYFSWAPPTTSVTRVFGLWHAKIFCTSREPELMNWKDCLKLLPSDMN